MNHHHRKVLHALFAHPVSANIGFKDVEHLLTDLGAEIDNRRGARISVKLSGHSVAVHHAQKSLPVEEVQQIRKFLETCGINPADHPL